MLLFLGLVRRYVIIEVVKLIVRISRKFIVGVMVMKNFSIVFRVLVVMLVKKLYLLNCY